MDDKLMQTLRQQAWQRAKGELHSMLATYWPEWTAKNEKIPNGFEKLDACVKAFIRDVEGDM